MYDGADAWGDESDVSASQHGVIGLLDRFPLSNNQLFGACLASMSINHRERKTKEWLAGEASYVVFPRRIDKFHLNELMFS